MLPAVRLTAVIRDSMYGMHAADFERWSPRVAVVRGLNPGPFTGPGTNTYLIGTGERPILLDTGSGRSGYVPLLEGCLRDEGKAEAPGDIVLTHAHGDHIGGAADLIAHFGERAVMKRPWPEKDGAYPVKLTPIEDGAKLRTEGATLRAIHTPGHSADHLCFLLEEESALFTGDLILGAGTTVIPLDGGSMAEYLDSLHRILALDIERIYPGHGPLIADPAGKIREYIEHRMERERQVVEAVSNGARTVEQMVERMYQDTPRALYPAAGQSVMSHLLKLESERRARRTIDSSGEDHWAIA